MKKKVVSDTFEQLGELAKDSAKAVTSEPAKILETALGGSDDSAVDEKIQEPIMGGKKPTSSIKSDPLIKRKKLEDQEKVQRLLQLHRQRLKEEEDYQERTVTEEEKLEELEEHRKKEEEQKEIVQLQKQDAKDATLNAPTAVKGPQGPLAAAKKKKGTKELGRQKD